ncbi:MAG: Ig domain-containing protein, partial [Chitinivibrionales bacterium]|nr:Ig domain-containing protein [Chitinivibrionales bacterium]
MLKKNLCWISLAVVAVSIIITCSPKPSPFNPPYHIVYAKTSYTFKVGIAAVTDTPVADGEKPMTFTIAPILPAGLSIDATNGIISGTAQDTLPQSTFTITATNNYGHLATDITITVLAAPPKNLAYQHDTAIYIAGLPIAVNIPNWTGGKPTSFAVAPTLPAGLDINPASGVIYG